MSDTPVETKTKSKRTTKPKVDKYNGFKVPKRTVKSTKWAIYLYDMIKEAKPELLSIDLVKDAYNNLVDCLIKYENTLETWTPSKYNKYGKDGNGIVLKKEYYSDLMGFLVGGNILGNNKMTPSLKNKLRKTLKKLLIVILFYMSLLSVILSHIWKQNNTKLKAKKILNTIILKWKS